MFSPLSCFCGLSFPLLAVAASLLGRLSCTCVMFFYQVVVKTKADYDGESKKGKLRSPKIAEFSISIIEGVSERLKVRATPLPPSVFHTSSPPPNICHTPTRAGEQAALAPDICHRRHDIPPTIQPSLWFLCSGHLHVLPPVILSCYTGRQNAQWFT